MKRSVQAISSSPCCGERERSTLRSRAAAISGSRSRSRALEQRIEQALAHAERRDHDLSRLDRAHQIFQHQRGIGEQRPAGGVDHLDLRQRLGVDAMHQPGEFQRLARARSVTVHDVQRIAGLPHVQPRQRAPGAADRVEGAALACLAACRDRRSASSTIFSAFLSDLPAMSCRPGRRAAASRRDCTRGRARRPVRASRRRDRRRCRRAGGCRRPRRARSAAPRACRTESSIGVRQMRSASAMKARPLRASRQAAVAIAQIRRPAGCRTARGSAAARRAPCRPRPAPAGRWTAPRGRGRPAPFR